MDRPISEELTRRDRFRQKLEQQVPIEERIRDLFNRMSREVPGAGMTPQGYQHFLRRNFRQRAQRML